MGYSRRCYDTVREAFEAKRNRADAEAEERRARLHRDYPELARLDQALSVTAMSVMEQIRKGKEGLSRRIAQVREENERLQEARAALLAGLGYPASETDPRYECTRCNDTGYADGIMCTCFRQALSLEAMRESGLGRLLDTQSFDSFSLAYYQGADRELAEGNLRACKNYAENFSLESSPNLTFIGPTGLGKTHMSTAIARVVIEKGFDVVYENAQTLFSVLSKEAFSGDRDERSAEIARKAGRYRDCDLLIVDDLGTEVPTKVTEAFLYYIINTRLNAGKKTIISTNLERDGLYERYGDRVVSRLFGEYIPLVFRGKDVRMQKLQR